MYNFLDRCLSLAPSPSATPDTTGMAKFWDNRYKFQFFYPKESTLINEGSDAYEQQIINGKQISGTQPPLLETFRLGSGPDEMVIQVPDNKVFPVYRDGTWDLRACGQNGFRTINSKSKINFAGQSAFYVVSTSVNGDVANYYCVNNPDGQSLIIIFNPESIIASKVLTTFSFFEPSPIPDPSQEWKMFKDDANDFEIQYPPTTFADLYIPPGVGSEDKVNYRVFATNEPTRDGNYYFSIYALPLRTGAVPCSEAAQNFTQPFRFEGDMVISGVSYPICLVTRKISYPHGYVVDEEIFHVSFNKNGYTWEFLATNYDKSSVKDVVDKMISTFKFTK
ncbi:MAG: hypothetical protein Q8R55_06340 [Candidatus Taylorbacteria bacterium]|nr:hypothetical protein [Candidatus Taylorbacteria bacterium]